jgi:peptidoglycan/xylan/chitin deacetylase (PgdA/CDA1 family)
MAQRKNMGAGPDIMVIAANYRQRGNARLTRKLIRQILRIASAKSHAFCLSGLFLTIFSSCCTAAACPPEALGTARVLPVGTKGGGAIGFKSYPQSLPLADHEVVLTFDDGPLPATTSVVLTALAKECVRATFFLIGRNAAAAPALVRREIAEGHTVAHHTMTHPPLTLRNEPDELARADIERGMSADALAAYGVVEPNPRVPFFRFPGFADTKALVDWLAARNIVVFGADLWASDWLPMAAGQELDLLMHRLEQAKKGILLLHDTKRQTAEMLPSLLRELKSHNYHIVHIVPGPGPLQSAAAGPQWTSETERILRHMWPRALPTGVQRN